MTRVTNFGRKRTYVQAGFANEDDAIAAEQPQASTSTANLASNTDKSDTVTEEAVNIDTPAPPAKKKRKRTPKSKRDGYAAQKAAEAAKLNGDPGEGTSANEEAASAAEGKEKEAAESATGVEYTATTSKPLSKSAKKKQRELKRKQKSMSVLPNSHHPDFLLNCENS